MKPSHWIVFAIDLIATGGPLAAVLSGAGYSHAALVIGSVVSMAVTLRAIWMTPPGAATQEAK